LFPFIQRIFADAAYDHERITTANAITVEIVRKLPGQVGFAVLPRRWVVTARTMLQE
jgi:putative transposase